MSLNDCLAHASCVVQSWVLDTRSSRFTMFSVLFSLLWKELERSCCVRACEASNLISAVFFEVCRGERALVELTVASRRGELRVWLFWRDTLGEWVKGDILFSCAGDWRVAE